jgi:cytochrome c2
MRRPRQTGLALLSALALAAPLAGCERRASGRYAGDEIVRATGGDPSRGAHLIRRYGCFTCHTIPGVPGANGSVGPSLEGVATRVILAGRLENNAPNLVAWLRHPHAVDPLTVMPEMGVSEKDARDIAAYLYTLR